MLNRILSLGAMSLGSRVRGYVEQGLGLRGYECRI